MQYQITQQVPSQAWEQEQASVIEELRQRAQHDLEVQNPNSTVTISDVQHNARAASPDVYIVECVFEYAVSGQTNTFAA